MLLQVGNKIINTDWIVVAEFKESEKQPSLDLTLAGGGYREHTLSFETFYGETARQLWEVLRSEAALVTETIEGPGGGGEGGQGRSLSW